MNIFSFLKERVRFNRNECAGAFGDIGTDLPLIIGMIQASGVDVASTLIMFGLMNILTGLIYGIPMAVQPLKAMAVIVITQKISANVLYGGGLSIAVLMILLTVSGLLTLLNRIIPKVAIRGIQLGLGLSLVMVSAQKYLTGNSTKEYILAVASVLVLIFLRQNRKYPASLIVIITGLIYSVIFSIDLGKIGSNIGFSLPKVSSLTLDNILDGLLILALPQLPLSLSNSVFATHQTIKDLFPEKEVGIKKIGLTYSLMNFINPIFSGIPTCHGTGGLMGQYFFGGRTGGSVIIYGSIYIILGVFFSGVFSEIIKIFPFPVLGAILLFEGIAMMMLIQDVSSKKNDLFIVILTGTVAAYMKNGFIIGLILGTLLFYLTKHYIKPESDWE